MIKQIIADSNDVIHALTEKGEVYFLEYTNNSYRWSKIPNVPSTGSDTTVLKWKNIVEAAEDCVDYWKDEGIRTGATELKLMNAINDLRNYRH